MGGTKTMSDINYFRVSKILADIELPKAPDRFIETDTFRVWAQAAGKDIADNTIKLQIEGNLLSVTVSSPTWAHALINSQATILNRLVELGCKNLEEMTIRVGVLTDRQSPRLKKRAHAGSRQREITPKMKELFIQIAENASNPATRDAFLRLSRSRPIQKNGGE